MYEYRVSDIECQMCKYLKELEICASCPRAVSGKWWSVLEGDWSIVEGVMVCTPLSSLELEYLYVGVKGHGVILHIALISITKVQECTIAIHTLLTTAT